MNEGVGTAQRCPLFLRLPRPPHMTVPPPTAANNKACTVGWHWDAEDRPRVHAALHRRPTGLQCNRRKTSARVSARERKA